MTQPLQANLLGLPMAPAEAVIERDKINLVELCVSRAALTQSLQDTAVIDKFCNQYRTWIQSTQLNRVKGLDQFESVAYSQGTTESFDKFYMKHRTRRFRCFAGEYIYHRLVWQRSFTWNEICNVNDLAHNDAVVVSLPFADTGNMPEHFNKQFLDRCAVLGIPVLVDCAFFGICASIDFDFDHPAISDICFSLSKTFPVQLLRIGLRFTREHDHDSLSVYHRAQYVNRLGAAVGLALLESQSPDEAYLKWRAKQMDFCFDMKLVPSNTVIFGIDTNHLYDQYNRGSADTNRICFSKYFESGVLPSV